MSTGHIVHRDMEDGYVVREPSIRLTAEELAAATSKWLPWLKCPLLRMAAAKGYRAHSDQRDVKEARWGRYVAAMQALGFPEELAERFRRGPIDPNGALHGLKAQWKHQSEVEAGKLVEQARTGCRKKQVQRFFNTTLAAKFEKPELDARGYLVWPGKLVGRGHAPRVVAGGGLSYGKSCRSNSTRRRRALASLGLVEVQEWKDSGARGTSSRAWTYAWTAKLTLEELENAAVLLAIA
mgnify:CR=1 FL=1